MWILDTDADFFQGRRMWLKPGQRYLFGRVKNDEVLVAIDHKTVSRQHFSLIVDSVKEGDVGNIYARTKIRVEDHSKIGTHVDDICMKKKDPKDQNEPNPSKELNGPEHTVRPGSCPYLFTITWQPCVFTFHLMKKEIKSGELKKKQASVQHYDIKAISDFSAEHTTHVVATKRNTPKGLQALINGKYLVTDAYVDALEYATTPGTLSQEINLSPLENDFDSAWPDPIAHLPPPGKEPTIKPPEAYRPDPARTTVFEHYIFVFCDQTQYDNLMPVITDGHGKALLFKVVNAETTSDDLLQYVQNARGHKSGVSKNNSSKGGVIIVRSSVKDNALQEWTTSIVNEVVLKMDQRAIDQSEFLEAILSNDAGLLKQAVPYESTNDSIIAPPPSAANSLASQTAPTRTNGAIVTQASEPGTLQPAVEPSNTPAPATQTSEVSLYHPSESNQPTQASVSKPFSSSKVAVATTFKDFDDGFDPDAVDMEEEDEVMEEENLVDPLTQPRTQTQASSIKQEPPSTSKKRSRTSFDEPADAFAEEMDNLLPAATAIKRRKLVQAAINGHDPAEELHAQKAPPRKIKKEKDIDVREVFMKRQEAEEAARNNELEQDLSAIEDKAPANLAVVSFDLPVRETKRKENGTAGKNGAGWDPKWNGRRNFKLFRRKGEAPQKANRARKVIVPLQEVPNKTGGFGDKYYERTEEERERDREKKRKEQARSQRATQSQTQQLSSNSSRKSRTRVVLDDEDDDDDDRLDDEDLSDANRSVRQTSPAVSRLQREAAEIADHEIDIDTPRQTRAAERYQATSVNGSDIDSRQTTQRRTQTQNGKRPANSSGSNGTAKRQKTLPVQAVPDDDSDDDDTKFRFGARSKRGRGRGGRG